MRNYITVSLLVIFTFIHMQLVELVKLPMLYTHFLEHKSENHTLSFMDFIHLHYSSDKHSEGPAHSQLPFKCVHELMSHNLSFIPDAFNLIAPLDLQVFFTREVSLYQEDYSFCLFNKIWQPPRF